MTESSTASRVLFLDVGYGASAIVCLPSPGEAILIDSADAPTTLRGLRKARIKRLRLVLVTHSDADHTRGIATTLRNFPGRVDRILYHPDRRRIEDTQQSYQMILKIAAERDIPSGPACSDQNDRLHKFPLDACCILYPKYEDVCRNLERGGAPNRASAVFFVSFRGRSFLFGGDLEAHGWDHLHDQGAIPRADVFLLPHHGGEFHRAQSSRRAHRPQAGINHEALLEQIAPQFVVISTGTSAQTNFPPHARVLDVLATYGANRSGFHVFCTELTVRCHPTPLLYRKTAIEGIQRNDWPAMFASSPASCPCGGTICFVVRATGDMSVSPDVVSHDHFVMQLPHPRCRPEWATR